LRREIAKGLSISMCGIPYWTVDAGAFFAGGTKCWRKWKADPNALPVWFWNGSFDEGVKDKGYQELYTRWLQFACFLPVFRSHGTDTPREAWEFEPPFYDAIVKTIKLRYHLAPYILEMARRVTAEHYTIMRSLLFDFPDDENAGDISDEFMFGENILVCPVTKPFYYGSGSVGLTGAAMEWECYLPKGTAWYNYWDHARYEGGQTVKVPVALEQIPLFVRAGTRLPTQNGLQSMTQSAGMAVEYEVFPE
jgi:alpha-D-xyloside xylohydrolase